MAEDRERCNPEHSPMALPLGLALGPIAHQGALYKGAFYQGAPRTPLLGSPKDTATRDTSREPEAQAAWRPLVGPVAVTTSHASMTQMVV